MSFLRKNGSGILLCFIIALICNFCGKKFPVIGGAVIAILAGMVIGTFMKDKGRFSAGIKFTSKKVLQYAVVLLGFGMNLGVVIQTGEESLPIILCTITTSLVIAFLWYKFGHLDKDIATLIGVGSSICGGSAIAATAPVIDANEEEVAQAISVIFFFNVLAALLFPTFGHLIGFSTTSGHAFGVFAGTAVNDTSSVTAAASTWDNLYKLGTQTLDEAVTVKLTRTLAIIPITLSIAIYRVKHDHIDEQGRVSIKQVFPFFIIYFVIASLITTIAVNMGVDIEVFHPFKELSKFFIVMAMSAIGLNTDIVKLVKSGGKPILLGFSCFIGITIVSLALQHILHIW